MAGPIGDVFVTLGDVIADLAGPVSEVIDVLGAALVEVAGPLDDLVAALGESLGVVLARLPALIDFAADAFVFLAEAATAVLGVFNDLPGPIQTVVIAIGGLILLRDKISGFGKVFTGLRDNITLLKPAFQDVGTSFSTMFQGMKNQDFSQVSAGMKTVGPALAQAAKSAGAAAGVAIAGALGIAFGAQMFAEADSMSGKVMGVMSIIGSAVGAFAAGGPIVGGVTVGLGLIGAAFATNANDAKKAAAEVDEYTQALMEMESGGDSMASVKTIMENLRKEQTSTRENFLDLGIVIEDWAKGVTRGTESAESAMADMAETTGSAGKGIAAAMREGELSVRDIQHAFEEALESPFGADVLAEKFRPFQQELEKAGVSMEEFIELADFLADETEELGLGQDELNLRLKESGGSFDDLNPKIEETAGLLGTEATDGANAAAQALGYESAAALQAAINTGEFDAAAISAATSAADLGDETGTLVTDFSDLEDALGDIDITKVYDDAGTAAARFEGLRRKMEETAEAAGEMKSAFDLLVGGQLSAQEATSNFEQTIDDLNQIMADGEGISGQFAATFDLTEEGGRNVAEALRGGIEEIGAYGEAQIAIGADAAATAAQMGVMRDRLVDNAAQFFATREEAEAFIGTILGFDQTDIDLSVEVAGMQKALDDLTEFDRDLDGIPDSKDFTFNAPTIETIRAKAAELGVDISKIPDDVVVEFFANQLRESLEGVEILGGNLDDIDGKHPEAEVTVRNEEALEATHVAAEAAGNFEGGSYAAVLQAQNDEAIKAAELAAAAAGDFGLLTATATLNVEDNTQPVLDPLTATLEVYDGNTYSADIDARDLVQPVLDPLTSTLETYNGNTYEADLVARDMVQPVLDPATATLETYAGNTYEADLTVRDLTTPILFPTVQTLETYAGNTYEADIAARDLATGVTAAAQGAANAYDETTASADVSVNGAEDAKTDVGEVKTGVEGLNDTTGAATVSLVNNVVVLLVLGAIQEMLDKIGKTDVKPKISVPDYPKVALQLVALQIAMITLNAQVAAPKITLPTWFTVMTQIGTLAASLRNLPDGVANVTVNGVTTAISNVRTLDQEIRDLRDRTVTVTTRRVTEIIGGSMTGSIVKGAMAGQMVTGPGLMEVGERGYDEAIIPMQTAVEPGRPVGAGPGRPAARRRRQVEAGPDEDHQPVHDRQHGGAGPGRGGHPGRQPFGDAGPQLGGNAMWPGWIALGPGDPFIGDDYVELVNNQRAYSYTRQAGISWLQECLDCPEAGLVMPGGPEFISPSVDPAPWYDVNNPDTWGFYGVVGLEVVGADASTRQVTITNTLQAGGIAGPPVLRAAHARVPRAARRPGRMLAAGRDGLAAGDDRRVRGSLPR